MTYSAALLLRAMPTLLFAARAVLFAAGAMLLFMAVFVYEDEQRELQSRIETWWIQLDDVRSGAMALELNVVSRISLAVSLFFDALLGKRLLSLRAAIVVNSLSSIGLAALCIFAILIGVASTDPHVASLYGRVIAFLVLWGVVCFLGTRYFFRVTAILWFLSLGWLAYVIFVAQGNPAYERMIGVGAPFTTGSIAYLISIVMGALAIAGVRALLRRAVAVRAVYALGVDLGAALVCFLSFVLPALWTVRVGIRTPAGVVGLWLFILSCWMVLFLGLLFVVAALLVLHHVLWPLIERPLYALQRTTIFDNKKATGSAGIALMAASLTVGTRAFGVFDLMKKLIGS